MKKPIIAFILAALILASSLYGVYSLIYMASPSTSSPPLSNSTPTPTQTLPTTAPTQSATSNPAAAPTTPPTKTPESTTSSRSTSSFYPIETIITEQSPSYVIIKDVYGNDVNVTLPVNRVVSITSGVTEIIYAIGAGDKVVGRDSYSVFPDAALQVPIVAQSSASPNTELIVDLKPDLIIADTMLSNSTKASLQAYLGVPVLIQSATQSDLVVPLVKALGAVMQKEQTAQELVNFMNGVTNLVADRLKNLSESQKPLVYYEWNKAWYSTSSLGLPHQMIVDAGGINLAANGTVAYPTLSPEYVYERNPDKIIRILSDKAHNITDFQVLRQEVMTRTGLVGTKAVQNQEVYILSSALRTGIRNPIGLLTMAKWLHPTLFADVDPVALHSEMIQKFFKESLTGTYSYP
ncbi:MAG: ABC transporter substrate-binding protein [Candidatus Bathyarchaeota archaeon]|nr:ABC transporter substrate-binding protein [Candidatus Bathyarchaeota archaeon]